MSPTTVAGPRRASPTTKTFSAQLSMVPLTTGRPFLPSSTPFAANSSLSTFSPTAVITALAGMLTSRPVSTGRGGRTHRAHPAPSRGR